MVSDPIRSEDFRDVLHSEVDTTVKFRYPLSDGMKIESCVIDLPYRTPHKIICVSSQVGCPYTCIFCATGDIKYVRNLTGKEIMDQVNYVLEKGFVDEEEHFDITYAGVGEPLVNMGGLRESSTQFLRNLEGLVSINISTIGPDNAISKLTEWAVKNRMHLQLSLHSPYDAERAELLRRRLPSINESLNALRNFAEATRDQPCLNYILFRNLNDSLSHAERLAKLASSGPFYVKITTFNDMGVSFLQSSSETRKKEFVEILRSNGIKTHFFVSKGQDIKAGCGQMLTEIG